MIAALALFALAQGPVIDNLNGVPTPSPSVTAPPADAPLKQGKHTCGTLEVRADGTIDPDARGCTKILNVGQPALFAGVELDEQEDVRRDNEKKNLQAQMTKAQTDYVLLPKPAVAALIAIAAGSLAALAGLSIAAAEHKL